MDERAELNKMEDHQLVAYWNLLQSNRRMIQSDEAKQKTDRHIPIVSELLDERGIPWEFGKRTTTA